MRYARAADRRRVERDAAAVGDAARWRARRIGGGTFGSRCSSRRGCGRWRRRAATVFVEVGPTPTLLGHGAGVCVPETAATGCRRCGGDADDVDDAAGDGVATLYVRGVAVDWARLRRAVSRAARSRCRPIPSSASATGPIAASDRWRAWRTRRRDAGSIRCSDDGCSRRRRTSSSSIVSARRRCRFWPIIASSGRRRVSGDRLHRDGRSRPRARSLGAGRARSKTSSFASRCCSSAAKTVCIVQTVLSPAESTAGRSGLSAATAIADQGADANAWRAACDGHRGARGRARRRVSADSLEAIEARCAVQIDVARSTRALRAAGFEYRTCASRVSSELWRGQSRSPGEIRLPDGGGR